MFEIKNFKPIDNEMAIRHQSILILNRYKEMGFTKRDAFINVINNILPKYGRYPNFRILENFWSGRYYNQNLNIELSDVLEKLKNE